MKISKILLIVLLFAKQAMGIYIVDPTYDFSFKALFGEVGNEREKEESKTRLISFLNSILNEDPFNIKINNLEYRNLDTQNTNGSMLRFDVRCFCTKQVNREKVDFEMDVEMQKSNQEDYFQRIVKYSARLLDIYKKREHKSPQIRVIVISILDCVLDNCKEDVIFRVGNFKKTLEGMDPKQNGKAELIDDTITHIGIQLPLYVQKIKNGIDIKYKDNPWLHLLASRRISKGEDCELVDCGKYDFEDELVASKMEQNIDVKEALAKLNRMATRKQANYEGNITRANLAINENKELEYRLCINRGKN